MPRRPPKDIAEAAKAVRVAMTSINTGIERLAEDSGWLMAMADNQDQVETLSSTRAETAFFLVKQLAETYQKLAEFYATAFTQV